MNARNLLLAAAVSAAFAAGAATHTVYRWIDETAAAPGLTGTWSGEVWPGADGRLHLEDDAAPCSFVPSRAQAAPGVSVIEQTFAFDGTCIPGEAAPDAKAGYCIVESSDGGCHFAFLGADGWTEVSVPDVPLEPGADYSFRVRIDQSVVPAQVVYEVKRAGDGAYVTALACAMHGSAAPVTAVDFHGNASIAEFRGRCSWSDGTAPSAAFGAVEVGYGPDWSTADITVALEELAVGDDGVWATVSADGGAPVAGTVDAEAGVVRFRDVPVKTCTKGGYAVSLGGGESSFAVFRGDYLAGEEHAWFASADSWSLLASADPAVPVRPDAASEGAVVEITARMRFASDDADCASDAAAQAGVQLAKGGRFMVLTGEEGGADGWVEVASDALVGRPRREYEFRLTLDYAAGKVVYAVRPAEGGEFAVLSNALGRTSFARAGSARRVAGIEFSGDGAFAAVRGAFASIPTGAATDGLGCRPVADAIAAAEPGSTVSLYARVTEPTAFELKPGVRLEFAEGQSAEAVALRKPSDFDDSVFRTPVLSGNAALLAADEDAIRAAIGPSDEGPAFTVDPSAGRARIRVSNLKRGVWWGVAAAETLEGLAGAEPAEWRRAEANGAAVAEPGAVGGSSFYRIKTDVFAH